MRFEQVPHNQPFKRMDALKNKVQSHINCVLNYFFWIHAMLRKF